jgi:hypothetical protein
MDIKEIFKPTKMKIIGLVILLIGGIISGLINFYFFAHWARILGPEGYMNFINSFKPRIFQWVFSVIWSYILISIILYIAKKK